MAFGEAIGNFSSKTCTGGRELIQGHGNGHHSLELILIGSADVLVPGIQDIMGRVVMRGEVDHEAFEHGIRDSLVLDE